MTQIINWGKEESMTVLPKRRAINLTFEGDDDPTVQNGVKYNKVCSCKTGGNLRYTCFGTADRRKYFERKAAGINDKLEALKKAFNQPIL